MKTFLNSICVSSIALGLVLLPLQAFSAGPSSDEIIGKIEANLAPKNVKSIYKFASYRLDKTVMNYVVQWNTRDINHNHGLFVVPDREKGREILRLDDNLWTFVPSVGKIVRIADRDSFAGGDFSNADILRVDWLNKYTTEMVKELPKQWIIDLKAKTPAAPYAKMRLWVDRQTVQPVKQQIYDSNGTLLKKCLYGSVKTFGKIVRPTRLKMENVVTGQTSELEIQEITEVPALPDSRFIVDNLGK